MPRIVRGGLIQATLCEPATSPVEKIKQAMIDKHVALIAEAAEQGRRGRLPAGAVLRPVLLRRAGDQVVRPHRANSRRADDQADAGARQEARDGAGRADVRGGHARRLLQHGRGDRRRRRVPRQVPQDPHPALQPGLLGEVLLPARATSATRCSTRRSARSASTSATTATSPKAPAAWAWAARRSCSTRRRPSRASANICGSSSSRPTRWRTSTSSARSIGPGWEEPWRIGEFYGQSYFCDPRGQFIAQATKRTEDDIVIADMDFDLIREVRNTWQFFRDRRPETYGAITAL